MTEEEHIRLANVGDIFYRDFSKLVARHIAKMPTDLETVTVAYLQDKCSIYGSQYAEYLNRMRRPEINEENSNDTTRD